MHSMRLGVLTLALLVGSVGPAAAERGGSTGAAPLTVTLALQGTHPAGTSHHEGTFTAAAPFCASGTWIGTGAGYRTFTCADGSGTFTAAFNGELEHAQGASGPWAITAGTGSYVHLRGKGTVTVDSSRAGDGSPSSPEWTFAETWRGIAAEDTVAPTIQVTRLTLRKLAPRKRLLELTVAFRSIDTVAGNRVSYTVAYETDSSTYQSGQRSGAASAGIIVVGFRFRLGRGARIVKLQIEVQDAVGNQRRLVRTLRLPA